MDLLLTSWGRFHASRTGGLQVPHRGRPPVLGCDCIRPPRARAPCGAPLRWRPRCWFAPRAARVQAAAGASEAGRSAAQSLDAGEHGATVASRRRRVSGRRSCSEQYRNQPRHGTTERRYATPLRLAPDRHPLLMPPQIIQQESCWIRNTCNTNCNTEGAGLVGGRPASSPRVVLLGATFAPRRSPCAVPDRLAALPRIPLLPQVLAFRRHSSDALANAPVAPPALLGRRLRRADA
jgi:hypothetical protein